MAIISPRSTNYERLEGGMGPSRTGRKGRFAWKRLAIGAAFIIGLMWVFWPRVRKQLPWDNKESSVLETHSAPPPPKTTQNEIRPPVVPPVHDDDTKAPQPHPTSFATDPDPTKTVYCSAPFKPSSSLVQYALMIDAGSTGSRIHVYKFNNCERSPTYEYETFKMTQPGLSHFSGNPLEAAKSLDVLMDEAIRVVPEALRKCTPLAVKATAGLRLLGSAQSAAILEAVQDRLTQNYPFHLQDEGSVVIMDGKDEGVYAWLTANYMLKTIHSDSPDRGSYAVLDLGGASTQIVFEPTFSQPDSSLEDGDHKYDLTFGGKKYVLYQHSYLGYGLMRARKSVHRLVDFMGSLRNATGDSNDEVKSNPCLSEGTRRIVEIEDERTGDKRNVTMSGEEVGSFEACNRVIELVLAKDAICKLKPCSFDGVYQPSFLDTFPSGKVLLLSYFYDRLHPLLSTLDPQRITVSTIGGLAQDVCRGKSSWMKLWGGNKAVIEDLGGRPEWCLDLTFMHGLLRLGYEIGERELTIGKQIGGTELGWALGATIVMVGGELKCTI